MQLIYVDFILIQKITILLTTNFFNWIFVCTVVEEISERQQQQILILQELVKKNIKTMYFL